MVHGPLAVILAAGQGTRMRSATPKVLHRLAGRPLIDHVLAIAATVSDRPPVVVVGPDHDQVGAHLGDRAVLGIQPQQLGTGDAVRAVPAEQRTDGPVLVTYADVPLVRAETIARMFETHRATGAACVLLSARPDRPGDLGRVMRDTTGHVTRVVEQRDLDPAAADTGEVNAGVYVFTGSALWPALDKLSASNAQGEYYLTDVVELLGGGEAVVLDDPVEALGINDRRQLATAEAELRRRTLDALLEAGVTIEDPATTYVDPGVEIGPDSILRPMTVLRGRTVLGRGCEIGPMAQLTDVTAGDRVVVGASVIVGSHLGDDVTIGHFNRVRPGSELGAGVSLGTHAEVKNSRIGPGSQINHSSCVLDSDVGAGVNIGAGAVTCNFDGLAKHRTTIGDRVFVGTNATLVAPVTLGDDSYIGAGSFINHDVPPGELGVGRAQQRNVQGWAERRRGTVTPA